MRKKQLGQFFTVRADDVLAGFPDLVRGKRVTDPFAGSGELLAWAQAHGAKSVSGFDVDRRYVDGKKVLWNDSILRPKRYDFVLTDPPYLYINKADAETKAEYFSGSEYEDLYQISLNAIADSQEGIVIVPVNFLSAENSRRIRDKFCSSHEITRINYFTEQVFPDTTYNVIAFHFKRSPALVEEQHPRFVIYPEGRRVGLRLARRDGWTIGSEALRAADTPNRAAIFRLTEEHVKARPGRRILTGVVGHVGEPRREFRVSDDFYEFVSKNIILLRAIDSGSPEGRIDLSDIRDYGIDCLVSKPTSRHMIHLMFPDPPSIAVQERLIRMFNEELNSWREKYDSLFLTNYRDNDRKRIGFDFVYGYLNYLLQKTGRGQGVIFSTPLWPSFMRKM